MIQYIMKRMNTLNREIGKARAEIEAQSITNPSHYLYRQVIEMRAQVTLCEELINEYVEQLKR